MQAVGEDTPPSLLEGLRAAMWGVKGTSDPVDFRTSSGWTALQLAVTHGRVANAEILLQMGANPHLRGPVAVWCVSFGDNGLLQFWQRLVWRPPSVEEDGLRIVSFDNAFQLAFTATWGRSARHRGPHSTTQ